MKKIILTLMLIALPNISQASLPPFPMALYGQVKINNTPAPTGSILRAYYGNVLASQVTVKDNGVYGDDTSIGQKLVIGEGSGSIQFTIQTPNISEGKEISGTLPQTYPGFQIGFTNSLDFNFTLATNNPPVITSSGGGSSGGGSYSIVPTSGTPISIIATTTINKINEKEKVGQQVVPDNFKFETDLKSGSYKNDVLILQQLLNRNGYIISKNGIGSLGNESKYFGKKTKDALIKFQIATKIKPSNGYFGAKTRALINSNYLSKTYTVKQPTK